MSGLFTSFGVGVSGLLASQNSINTTSHNIVNADTDGYARQRLLQNDRVYSNLGLYGAGTNQVGSGTTIATVDQLRDVFLDASFRKESGRQGFYQAQYEAVQEVEELFGELEGVQFQNVLEEFWKSVEELAKEPESIVTRASLVQSAENFLERADNIYAQLAEFQQNLNTKVLNTVNRINEIGKEIHALNEKIRNHEAGTENANDYRDTRNLLLDELGGLVKITYHEYEDGVVTVNIEGSMFVTDFGIIEMNIEATENELKVYQPVWGRENGEPVYNFDFPCSSEANTDIGFLKGLLLARGDAMGTYMDIPVAPDVNLYESAEDERYISAMARYEEDVRRYNNFTGKSVIMNVQAQFDQLVHGVVTTMNDILSPTLTGTFDAGGDIVWRDREGNVIPEEDAPQWTSGDLEEYATELLDYNGQGTGRFVIRILDTKNASVGMDPEATMGEALFSRKSFPRYEAIDMGDESVFVYQMEDKEDGYSIFTLGEIEINPAVRDNLSKIPLSMNTGTGDYDMKTAAELVDAWNQVFATLSPNTLSQNNFMDYYTALIADVANTGQTLKAIADNQEVTANGVDDQRQQVMGVSSDEELTYLIKFQHAYNASSRYITVIDEMLEHLLTHLG